MPQRLHPSRPRAPLTDGRSVVLRRRPFSAVLLLGAVLGALLASASAAYAATSQVSYHANRGWDAPSSDVVDRLDGA
jgi:hypothetical protein